MNTDFTFSKLLSFIGSRLAFFCRRVFRRSLTRQTWRCSLAISSLLLFGVGTESSAAEPRPNVIFIGVDDMADWIEGLSLPGYPKAHAPNFDRLIKRGILFTQAYCVSPHCGPSRAAIMTGLRPETSKIYTGLGNYLNYVPNAVSLPQHLRNSGYQVIGAGKINHPGAPKDFSQEGWDEYGPGTGIVGSPFTREELLQKNFKPTSAVKRVTWEVRLPLNKIFKHDRENNEFASFDWGPLPAPDSEMPDAKIADWAVTQLARRFEKPFFLGVGFYKPHLPFYAPQKYFDLNPLFRSKRPPIRDDDLNDLSATGKDFARLIFTAGGHSTIVESGQWEQAIQAYLACISFVDAQIGRILDALDRSAHAKNTIVILWSDHGWMLGEKEHWGKFAAWERSNRVPLIIAPTAATVARRPDLAGARCPAPASLLDLYPTLIDLCRAAPKPGLDGVSLAKLVENPRAPGADAAVITIGRGTHAVRYRQWHYIRYFDGTEELYDLENDRNEWTNIAGDQRHRSVKAACQKFIPLDPDIRRYARFGNWKAVLLKTGAMELYDYNADRGISEEKNVAAAHPNIVAEITRRLAQLSDDVIFAHLGSP